MREHKFVPMLFSFYDRTGIEKYLESQARKGWVLEKVTPLGWKFRREEPKDAHYTVCYFPGASPYDPEPSEAELTFREFCSHTGWEIVVSNGQMKVFRNENPDPVPIETDPLLELENIHASVKKTFLPVYIMDLILGIMQIGLFISRVNISFIGTFSSDWQFFGVLWWSFLIVLCVVELLRYFLWRRRAIRLAQEEGSFLETPNTAGFQCAIVVTSIGALLLVLLSVGNPVITLLMMGTIGGIFAVTALVFCGNVFHDSFVLADAAPWGADKAYQLKQGGVDEMSQIYILCYPGRLVKIQFGWDVTQEQMEKIGNLLEG